MTYENKKAIREWNKPDISFFMLIVMIVLGILTIVYGSSKIIIMAHNEIKLNEYKISSARQINEELQQLYEQGKKLEMDLIKQKDYEKRKKVYSQEEEKKQKSLIKEAHTTLAKKYVPKGTWVKLIPQGIPLKVIGHDGFECITEEGVRFMSTEKDVDFEFISQKQYDLLKNKDFYLKMWKNQNEK